MLFFGLPSNSKLMLLYSRVGICFQVFSSSSHFPTSIITVYCHRGGGDFLRQLHDLAEADSELSTHQKKLSEIETQVDLECPLIFAWIDGKLQRSVSCLSRNILYMQAGYWYILNDYFCINWLIGENYGFLPNLSLKWLMDINMYVTCDLLYAGNVARFCF